MPPSSRRLRRPPPHLPARSWLKWFFRYPNCSYRPTKPTHSNMSNPHLPQRSVPPLNRAVLQMVLTSNHPFHIVHTCDVLQSDSSESDDDKPPPPPPPRRKTRGADPSIKPMSSKPMGVTPKSKKNSSQLATEKKKRKQPEAAEEEETAENGMSEKKPFQRVWSEEERGFFKFIRKYLDSEYSNTEIYDKIRRLKKKYETNMRRSKRGVEPSFSKPHDRTVFELCKVWGRDVNRKKGKRCQPGEEEEEALDNAGSSPKADAKFLTPKTNEAAVPATNTPGSSSDSESDSSESDDDKPPPPPRRTTRGADPSIKPISSKPMGVTPKSEKISSQLATEKRKRKQPEAAEEEETTENGMSEKKPFQRVWSEEDEITVLKGMIQSKERGDEPEAALDSFLKFIRKYLHSEFSKTQLSDKIRRLRKKYETNMRRSKRGVEPSFMKPHDQTLFELSKKVWGRDANRDYRNNNDMEIENAEEEGGKANRKSMPASAVTSPKKDGGGSAVARGSPLVDGKDGEGKVGVSYPKLKEAVALLETENAGHLFVGSLSEALELVEPERAKVLEEKWHGHFVAGIKYVWERSELKEELLKTLFEVVKNT